MHEYTLPHLCHRVAVHEQPVHKRLRLVEGVHAHRDIAAQRHIAHNPGTGEKHRRAPGRTAGVIHAVWEADVAKKTVLHEQPRPLWAGGRGQGVGHLRLLPAAVCVKRDKATKAALQVQPLHSDLVRVQKLHTGHTRR